MHYRKRVKKFQRSIIKSRIKVPLFSYLFINTFNRSFYMECVEILKIMNPNFSFNYNFDEEQLDQRFIYNLIK